MAGRKKQPELAAEEKLQQALVPEAEQPYKVPDNWCWTYWGNCGEFIAGNAFKKDYQGFQNYHIPFYKVGSLKYSDDNGILYDNSNTINDEILKILKATLIPVNSIIFAKIGEAIRLNRRSINNKACCIDNNLMAFVSKVGFWKYFYFWSLQLDLYDYTNATTVPAIRKSDLEGIEMPLPPLAEQQRIVERIETLFAKLDEAKEKLQNTIDTFETRKAAILHKAFTGELTANWRKQHGVSMESWEERKIENIGSVKGGKRVPKGLQLTLENTGHPYIKAGNLKQGTVIKNDIMFVPEKVWNIIKNYTVSAGDVYITNVGACIGDCGIIPEEFDGANLTENAVKITDLLCNNKFLSYYLSSNSIQSFIKTLIASATLGKLSIFNIKNIQLNLPTLPEQTEIVRIIDDLLAKEQQAKELAENALAKIDLIKKSILARAFRGELGTNNPADEPAVELLKRVL